MALCWHSRRISYALLFFIACSVTANEQIDETVSERVQRVHVMISESSSISMSQLSGELIDGFTKEQGRIAIFEFVRDIEYRITKWRTGHPEDILAHHHGDCRHKADLLRVLFSSAGYEVRPVKVIYDWADLPVPYDILEIRGVTRTIHDAVQVHLGETWVYVDATWHLEMKELGFPIVENWDGITSTRMVTDSIVTVVDLFDAQNIAALYDEHKVPWPVRSKNIQFVRAFNRWLRTSR